MHKGRKEFYLTAPSAFSIGCESVSVFLRLDFDLVAVSEKLGAESERFALKGEVDEGEGLRGLLLRAAPGDLIGVELKGEPAEGDGFHRSIP